MQNKLTEKSGPRTTSDLLSFRSVNFIVPTSCETTRLKLRMFEESDCAGLHEMFSDEECVRYTLKSPQSSWQTWRILATYLGHWQLRGYGPYAVVEKNSGSLVGVAGLWYPSEWPEPEIKWSLTRKYWGQGYATEAATAIRDLGFTSLKRDRLISLILPENDRSKAVTKRIGGKFEKTIPFRDGLAEIYVYRAFSAPQV